MTSLEQNSTVVYDFDQLKAALEAGSTYDLVFLGADIPLSGGITIDPNKDAIILDGTWEDETHTLTEPQSISQLASMGIFSSSSIEITLRNIHLVGGNYYGMPYIADSVPPFVDTTGVVVIYDHVTYRGPQLAFHSFGRVQILDSDIEIVSTGSTEAQELAELNRLELGGTVTVRHRSTSTTRAVLWFSGEEVTRGLEVLPGADVTITSDNNFFLYALTILGIARPTPFHVGAGAKLSLDMNRGISFTSAHLVPRLTVDAGGSFRLIQRSAVSGTASLYLSERLEVAEGADVLFQTEAAGAMPLIHFPTAGFSLNLADPKSVVLRNTAGPALSFGATGGFDITTGQANRWSPAGVTGPGGPDDEPTQKWNRPSWLPFRLQGTLASGQTVVTDDDFTPDERANLPNLNLLQMQSAEVLSFGNLPLTIDLLTDDGAPVGGLTEPEAAVRVTYDAGGAQTMTGTAGPDGVFSFTPAAPIPAGTVVTVEANTPFLVTKKTAEVVEAGELSIVSADTPIPFTAPPLADLPDVLLPRVQTDAAVVVSDTRAVPGQWALMAQVTGPLRTADGDTMEDAVVFRDALGALTVLGATPHRVHLGGPGVTGTTVSWPATEGILIRPTAPIRAGVEYSTVVRWSLEEVSP